jgi:hypothetical protein
MAEPKAQWTLLTYIAAHNNLAELGKRSLAQILGAGSTSAVKLAALYDGPSGAARYIAGEPGSAAVEEPLGDVDSGDPDLLLETVRWAFDQLPAERYGLILWSHGTGWRPEEIKEVAGQVRSDASVDAAESNERSSAPGGLALFRTTLARMLAPNSRAERAILFDDGSGHSLDTLELDRVTDEVRRFIGQPLDLLGMDACLMATLEVAYQLRESVRYLVASEELVPGSSWPYDLILGDLLADPTQSASALAAAVVRSYTEYYTGHPPSAGDVTKVALDLGKVEALAAAADALAGALFDDIDGQADRLWKAQWACYQQESQKQKREPNKFRYHLWDLGSLAGRLAAASPTGPVAEAAQAIGATLEPGGPSVLAEGHRGDWFDGIGGVSIYLMPPKRVRVSPYYGELAFAKATRWQQLLDAYHAHYA